MSVKEYEDLIDEQDLELDNNKKKRDIPQDGPGDFEDIIDESDSEKELMLANSLKRAVKQNPDRRAEVLKLSNLSSLPPDFVERNFDLVKTKIAESSVETTKLTKRAPKTTDWLKEYDNAIVAKDDIESLKKIEDATSSLSFFDKVKKTASDVTDYFLAEEANDINLTKSLKLGFAQAGKSLAQVPAFARDMYYSNVLEEKKRIEENIKRYEQAGVRKNLYEFDKDRLDRLNEKLASGQVRPSTKEEFNSPLAVYFDKHASANQFPELNREVFKELIDNGNYAKAGETAFYKAMANLPNSAIILGSALAKVPGVGLGYAGVTTAAGEQAKAVSEVGDRVSREDITQASITKGAIEVGFEGIGLFGFMQPWANALSKEFGKQTAKEVLKNVGKTAAYSFAENANEEAWTSAFQNLTDVSYGIQPLDTQKILSEAVESFLVGGISGATMTTPSVFALAGQRIQDVQKAQEAKKTFEAIGDATKDSKLKVRLPEKLREYVDSVTKDGPVSDVYISTEALETFFQSKNESVTKMAQDMGILAEYNAAKEAGLDVKIPLSEAVEKLVDNGYYKELSDDVKFSPEAKTVNEIKKEKLEQEALIKEGLKEITEESFSYEDSAKEIGSQITKQLMDTGMKQKDAKVQGLIYENVFLNYGRRLKVDPKELFDKFALSIGKGEAPVEGALFQSDANLIVQHNLTEEDLLHVKKIGGLAAPSLAISSKEAPLENFGGISLLATKDFLKSSKVKSFDADVYSPRYPQVSYDLPKEGLKKITELTKEGRKKIFGSEYINTSDIEKDGIEGLKKDAAFIYQFLTENKIEPKLVYEETSKANIKKYKKDGFEKFFGTESYNLIDKQEFRDKVIESYSNEIKSDKELSDELLKPFLEDRNGYQRRIIKEYADEIANIGKQNLDVYKTERSLREQVSKNKKIKTAFDKYANEIYSSLNIEESIPREMPSGEYKYVDHNLENVVREMTRKIRDGEGFNYGVGNIRASLAHEFKSIADIKNNRSRLVSDEVMQSLKKETDNEFFDLVNKASEQYGKSGFSFTDSFAENLKEMISRGFDFINNEYYDGKLSQELGEDISIFLDKLKNMETHYFEVKAARAVGVNEFAAAVVPKGVSKEALNYLKENNVKIYYYNANDEKSRIEAISKAANENQLLFQGSPTDPRGQIRFGKDAINIDLLKNADMSTFLHETGHFFFKVMQDISAKAEAPQDIKDDFNVVKEFLGEVGDKFTVEQQEKFARGFEAYLMEGKAPSKQLKKAFERFKVWLLDVYKSLTNLNVELTPEIRAVFDRMFVAETETSIVENEVNKDLMLSDPHGVLSEAGANKYLELKELANKDAKEKLTAKLMKDVVIAQKKEYKAKFEEIKNSTIEKAKELTVFKAISAIQGDMKLDSNVIKKDFAQFKDSLPPKSTTTKEGAAHPDVVAQVFGYENGQAMLEDIAPYRKGIEDYAENIALGEMKKLYPELLESPELSNEAIESYHNDNLRKLKTLELEFLTKESPRIPKEIAARLIRRMPRQAEVKEQASEMIAQSKVSELSPHRYRLAERRAANDAAKAYKRGDFEAAFEAKRKELLAFELYVQAFEAKADVDKSIKSFKKILKSDEEISKNRDVNYVNVAQAILSEFGITRGDKTSAEYLEAMSKYDPEGYANVSQLFTEAVKDADNYKNVSYDKFVSMKESVSAIFDLAKSVKEIEIDGKAMDKEVILGEMTSQIQKIAPTDKAKYEMTKDKLGKFKVSLLSSKSRMTRIEAWSEAMDIEGRGPFKRYLFQPISDATAKYRLAKSDVMDKYLKLLKDNKKIFSNNVINADELGFAFRNKTELLMALLHSGNMSNLTKLLAGRKWGEALDNGQLDTTKWDAFISRMQKDGTLTKADYDFVQSVWDLNESLKPDAQKAHKKMFGYYFNEITAQSIQTPWGEYRGGYIPAKADVYSVEDAAIRQEREEFEKNNSSFMFPTTGRGFTKSRSEGYNVPLSLDMNLLGSHIDGVLRFTHIEPRVKELSRLMMDKNFRAELAQVDSEIAKDAIIPWLQRAATQQVISSAKGGDKALDATARFIRKTVAMQIMTGNVVNTVQQFTGLVVATSKVSPKHISKALFQYVASRNDSVNQAIEKSEWMESTQGSNIFETQQHINEILVNPTVFENIQNFASKHTYFLQSAAQNIVNTVVWNAAYDQNVTEGKSEIEAIRNADAAVRTTQGTTNAEDVSAFETGSPAQMLFKQFVSYFNMLANLNASELLKIQRSIGLKKGAGKAFYLYLTALAIPAILSEALVLAMSGQPLDADDDDSYMDDVLAVIFGSQFKTITAMVPYYGQVAVAAYNQFNNKMYDDRLSLSPAISVIESLTGVPKEIYKDAVDKGEIQKRTVKDTLQLIGVLTGTPLGPIGKPIGYLMDVESGKIEEPTGPVDLVRGLVTGKGNRQ